jgi:ribonucleoside-diphosphate reductase alpha chain
MPFDSVSELSDVALNILQKRYFKEGETRWEQNVDRVVNYVMPEQTDMKELVRKVMRNRYFLPNSPTLVNAGSRNGGLSACYVVGINDSIEEIYKTKLNFALIAKKGGGCGVDLSRLRPKNSPVAGSTHGYSGGPVDFADTISHDMEAMTQSGFRSMAIMFVMNVYHPDIKKFITAKEIEGKISNANISVMVDDEFMRHVDSNETYWTTFNGKKYEELNAREVFNMIVDGAWRNGEPGLLFYDKINKSTPYRFDNQVITGTNPCLSGDTLIQTIEGLIKIEDLVGKEIDVYCQIDDGVMGISKASNIRKTKTNANVIKIVTTRGELICTPDHLIYTKNRGYVEAWNLTVKDKLVSINQKMHGEAYKAISLTGTNKYVKEHRFIAGHYYDINGKVVHHKDGNSLNNKLSNLEVLDVNVHNSISNIGHRDWNEHDDKGQYISKDVKSKPEQLKLGVNPVGTNLRILSIDIMEEIMDVYDMDVETYHNFFANNIMVHNCAEQPMPENGSCNLGSIDVSKLLNEDGTLDLISLEVIVRAAVNFLDAVIDVNIYPTEATKEWVMRNRSIGVGPMGIADMFLKQKIAYGSKESIQEVEFIMNYIYKIAEDESISLGELKGVPEACKNLPVPRRNMTLTTIAPTGTLSLIAGCSSGIEPIFSEFTTRTDQTGTYQMVHVDHDKPYFRCAVSSNGSTEVTWREHLDILNAAQRFVDSGVSKTINFPSKTHKDTIGEAMLEAWRSPYTKGVAVYRNGSREKEVLSPKELKKDKCPVCKSDMIKEGGCKHCSKCDFQVCEIG